MTPLQPTNLVDFLFNLQTLEIVELRFMTLKFEAKFKLIALKKSVEKTKKISNRIALFLFKQHNSSSLVSCRQEVSLVVEFNGSDDIGLTVSLPIHQTAVKTNLRKHFLLRDPQIPERIARQTRLGVIEGVSLTCFFEEALFGKGILPCDFFFLFSVQMNRVPDSNHSQLVL
jgi:hypothetical protein